MQFHSTTPCKALKAALRPLFLVVMLSVLTLGAYAQANSIVVEKFDYDPHDQTAVTYPVKDKQSRRNCALVIFKNVSVGDYQFSVNGFSERQDKTSNGEKMIYLYVFPGCKVITIANPKVSDQPLRYNVGRQLESGKTYFATMGNVYMQTNQKQYLIITLVPPQASVEVNGEPWPVTNGKAQKAVTQGRYEILARCPDYHDYRDIVEMQDASKPFEVTVKLQPAFGYLDIEGGTDAADGAVYVDGLPKGTGNVKQVRLASGDYTVKIAKEHYKVYEGKVTIKDGETTVLRPVMTPDFSVTTLTVDNDAEIWIGDKMLARGTWTGPLDIGEYIVEARKAGHESRKTQIKIETIEEAHSFTITAPKPIYGEVDVTSTPSAAVVKLDGTAVGHTPYHINNVLVGDHVVEVELPGYQTYRQNVTVVKDQTANVQAKLSNIITLKVQVSPVKATLRANGKEVDGTSPFTVSGRVGSTVTLLAQCSGYKDKEVTETFDRNGRIVSMVLKEKGYPYYAPRGVYIDLGGSLLGITGVNANMGWYIGSSGFNVEADFEMNFSETPIYWNSTAHDYSYGSTESDYKAMAFGGRVGYGIRLNRTWEPYIHDGMGKGCVLTPQVGIRNVMITDSYNSINTHCTSLNLGLRFEWRTALHFGFYVVPEYNLGIMKGKVYEAIAPVSPTIKKWGEGFNLRLGFSIIIG